MDDGFYAVLKSTAKTLLSLIQNDEGAAICKAKSFKNGQEEEFLPMSAALRVCGSALRNFGEIETEVVQKLEAKAAKTARKTEAIKQDEPLVRTTDLMAVILSFKVAFHYQFLNQVRRNFRRFEKGNSGFIPVDQLNPFLDSLDGGLVNPKKPIFRNLLGKGWRFVSFSHVVDTLSQALVYEDGGYHTVLDKLYIKFKNQ